MDPDTLPENPPPPDTSATAAAQQSPANGTPAITPDIQALIDARVRDAEERARNATWKQARESLGKKKAGASESAQQPAQQPTATTHAPAPSGDDFGRVRAYERTLARYDFTDDALAMLDERFASEKPADVSAWVGRMANAFRVPQRGATTTATSTTSIAAQSAAVVAPAGPPVTGNAAPSNATTVTADTPLAQMSEADRQAFIKQHGIVAYTDRFKTEARERGTRIPLSALLRR